MTLSVIIPAYNVEQYLTKTLDSILAQSYSPLDIIIVNDGSTDGTARICDSYAERYAFVSVIHQDNQGLSAARNRGIAQAKGEHITFIDGDDEYGTNDTLKENMRLFKEDRELDFVQFPIVQVDMLSGEQIYVLGECLNVVVQSEEEYLSRRLLGSITHNACNKIYRSEIFKSVLFREGHLCEDAIFNNDIVDYIGKICLTNYGFYRYNRRPRSITTGEKSDAFYGDYLYYHRVLFDRALRYPSTYGAATHYASRFALLYRELPLGRLSALLPEIRRTMPPVKVIQGVDFQPKSLLRMVLFLGLKFHMLFVRGRVSDER